MLTLPAPFESHLQGRTASLTYCTAITKKTGAVIRGTAHGRDIVISTGPYAGTYKKRAAVLHSDVVSGSGGEVPNVDLQGVIRVDAILGDLTIADIEGGLYDQAPAVLFKVNWRSPNDGQKVVRKGTVGEFYRESTGRFRSEVRGIAQALRQQIIRAYSDRCDVALFGDARCKFNVAAVTRTGDVSSVTDRRHFVATLDAGPTPPTATYFDGGRLVFTSGANNGVVREVKSAAIAGSTATIELWDETPVDVEVGDEISLPPACDRTAETCKVVHNNFVNFQGYGLFAVGRDRLMRGPK